MSFKVTLWEKGDFLYPKNIFEAVIHEFRRDFAVSEAVKQYVFRGLKKIDPTKIPSTENLFAEVEDCEDSNDVILFNFSINFTLEVSVRRKDP